MSYPVIDLHCDLLANLLNQTPPDPFDTESIGCSFPALKEGNVKLQVMAIFSPTQAGSTVKAVKQSLIFKVLLEQYPKDCFLVQDLNSLEEALSGPRIGMIAAIENASGLCEEDEPLEQGFKRLEEIIQNTTRLLYIGLTHHPENRFGGGNNATAGLKDDGKALLEYLSGRKIAIDLSHASDALAHDLLNYIDQHNLDLRVIASHSNYREVFHHVRNLPNELAQEIMQQNGLIGLNFLRAFVNNDRSDALYDHLQHGLDLGGANTVCFGADFFCTDHHPDRSRVPFYFAEHADATRYPAIQDVIATRISPEILPNLSSGNVQRFLKQLWS